MSEEPLIDKHASKIPQEETSISDRLDLKGSSYVPPIIKLSSSLANLGLKMTWELQPYCLRRRLCLFCLQWKDDTMIGGGGNVLPNA